MIFIQFFIGMSIYLLMAFASYSTWLKESKIYFPLGILAAIIANFIWLSIAKSEVNPSVLMIKGLVWDAMLTGCYLLVPILFFNARFTFVQGLGVILVIIGLLLTKVPA